MLKTFAKFCLFVLAAMILFGTSVNRDAFADSDLTDNEIGSLRKDFCSLGELEIFYLAEQKILANIDDARVIKLLENVAKEDPELLVQERAERILELAKQEIFNELKTQSFFAQYFSSDFDRRLNAVLSLWEQNDVNAEKYLFNLIDNDQSYEVKIKALLTLADFNLSSDKTSSLVILAESSDENLATASIFALLENAPLLTAKTLMTWIQQPNYPWQKGHALQAFELYPELMSFNNLTNLLSVEKERVFLENLCEIAAQKVQTATETQTTKLLNVLKNMIEQGKVSESASWEKLWSTLATNVDLVSFFREIENKQAIPDYVWRNVAFKDKEYMLSLAFTENKYFRNLARVALARAGFALDLIKLINVNKINENEFTLNEIVEYIRRECHFEIYLSSYAQSVRDRKVHAYFGKCTLHELLSILTKHLDLRLAFDNGRLLIYPEALSYRGFRIDPIFLKTKKASDYFSTYIAKAPLQPQCLPEFSKTLRDLTQFSVVINTINIPENYKTPKIEKNQGVLAVLRRSLNENELDAIIMANSLWIVDKSDAELFEFEHKLLLSADVDTLHKLAHLQNDKKFQFLSKVLQSDVAKNLSEQNYKKVVLDLLNSAKANNDVAALIPCLKRLVMQEDVIDKLLEYSQSLKFSIRFAATATLARSDVDVNYLLQKYLDLKLNAQKIITRIASRKLKMSDLDAYLVKLIESGNIKQIDLNFMTLSKLIFSVFLAQNQCKPLDKRAVVDIQNAKIDWFLHLLRVQTRQNIYFSPYLQKKLVDRPILSSTPLSLKFNVQNIEKGLNFYALLISTNTKLDELLPVPKIYDLATDNRKSCREFAFAYPFEFERLIGFETMLRSATKIKAGFEKEVFEYVWNLSAMDELMTVCKSEKNKLVFINRYKSRLVDLIKQFENSRTNISPEFARLFIRLRKLLNLDLPEIYNNYKDFPEDWFLPDDLKNKPEDKNE